MRESVETAYHDFSKNALRVCGRCSFPYLGCLSLLVEERNFSLVARWYFSERRALTVVGKQGTIMRRENVPGCVFCWLVFDKENGYSCWAWFYLFQRLLYRIWTFLDILYSLIVYI